MSSPRLASPHSSPDTPAWKAACTAPLVHLPCTPRGRDDTGLTLRRIAPAHGELSANS